MRPSLKGIDPAAVPIKKDNPAAGFVESSAHMRQRLADEGKPVLVAFSRGKDSICATLALMAAGVEVVPVHLYRVPGLSFEEESLADLSKQLGLRIHNYPHPDLFYYLNTGIGQAPWQNAIAEAAQLPDMNHALNWALIREDLGLAEDTWVCDGIRAADSPNRRMSIIQRGPWTDKFDVVEGVDCRVRLAHVVWDWKIKEIRQCLKVNNVSLPIDYELFNRTFDGIDYRFIKPLCDKAPEDFAQLARWFPAVEMEMMRYEFI